MLDPIEFCPGDPPLWDMLLCLALFIVLLALANWLHSMRWRPPEREWLASQRHVRSVATPRLVNARRFFIGSLMLAGICTYPLAARHFGIEGRLKQRLLELRANFLQFRSEHPELDEEVLIERFKAERHAPWLFQFTPEYRPVSIQLTHGTPAPTFRIAYGHSAHNEFDLDTMWVTYCD